MVIENIWLFLSYGNRNGRGATQHDILDGWLVWHLLRAAYLWIWKAVQCYYILSRSSWAAAAAPSCRAVQCLHLLFNMLSSLFASSCLSLSPRTRKGTYVRMWIDHDAHAICNVSVSVFLIVLLLHFNFNFNGWLTYSASPVYIIYTTDNFSVSFSTQFASYIPCEWVTYILYEWCSKYTHSVTTQANTHNVLWRVLLAHINTYKHQFTCIHITQRLKNANNNEKNSVNFSFCNTRFWLVV